MTMCASRARVAVAPASAICVKVTLSPERSTFTPVCVVEVFVQERLICVLLAAVAARLVGAVGGGGGACVAALAGHPAVGVAVPSSDTIAVVSDGVMSGMPRRDSLVRCQTPQGFRLSVIRKAHELAAADPRFGDLPATDDCGIVLRYLPEVKVHIVPGSERNIKITYPRDLAVAEALLRCPQ